LGLRRKVLGFRVRPALIGGALRALRRRRAKSTGTTRPRFRVNGFRVWDSGFMIQDLGFRVWDSGFRIQGLGFSNSGFGIQGLGFSDSGFGIQGLGFSDSGFRIQGLRSMGWG